MLVVGHLVRDSELLRFFRTAARVLEAFIMVKALKIIKGKQKSMLDIFWYRSETKIFNASEFIFNASEFIGLRLY